MVLGLPRLLPQSHDSFPSCHHQQAGYRARGFTYLPTAVGIGAEKSTRSFQVAIASQKPACQCETGLPAMEVTCGSVSAPPSSSMLC